MDGLIRCSSLVIESEEHLKTQIFIVLVFAKWEVTFATVRYNKYDSYINIFNFPLI
jgi:hypothetical protein